jgi:hypothetical protein
MTQPRLRVVLDTSAIVAYLQASIHVGETIAEVVDEGAGFGVPVVCLAEAVALRMDGNGASVDLLVAHPACTVLPMLATDWRALASAARMVGRIDLGVALLAAVDHDAYVLTGEPGPYGALVDDGPVIPI